MLTTEHIERITVEATVGKPPSIKTKEALTFRKKIEQDIKDITHKGGTVEIVSDN